MLLHNPFLLAFCSSLAPENGYGRPTYVMERFELAVCKVKILLLFAIKRFADAFKKDASLVPSLCFLIAISAVSK